MDVGAVMFLDGEVISGWFICEDIFVRYVIRLWGGLGCYHVWGYCLASDTFKVFLIFFFLF